ncbi:transcriptional regulator with XRE-family HTH domain [Faecalicoccus acidiformans]|uniref:Transcriptional regulator with XRE-family HTH domain n=1 Tax=Faecalicoccus acidiformans TaxID=915173 RepID=A0A7W8FX07_9FIRM|nr:helix-turn-helix transcriptional regulator [Faecalicoccus acidiformans]MBB5184808.1 transcriptional regulator with XRE-family HTH domain [Faecalicoccus acidiformans]
MNELRKDRIEKRLNELKQTKSWLAQQMNMSLQSFSRMLGGNNNPRIDNVIELSKKLDISIDYLLGVSEESTIDVSLKDISEKTGLSVKSIEKLICYKNNKLSDRKLKALNLLLENNDLLLSSLYDYLSIYPIGETYGNHEDLNRSMLDYDKEKILLFELTEAAQGFKSHLKYEFDEQYRNKKIDELELRIFKENLTEEEIDELSKLIKKLKNYDKDSLI